MRRLSLSAIVLALIMVLGGCASEPALTASEATPAQKTIEESLNTDFARIERLYTVYQKDPKNREALLNLTSAYQKRGDDFSCIAAYKQYLEYFPDNAEILVDLAYAQMNLGYYEDAQVSCEKAIEADNSYATAYNAMGNVLGDKTQYAQAIYYYRKALELNKDYEPARTNILWALYHGAQYEKCIEEAQKQIKQGYEYYDLYYYLGRSYEATHLTSEAQNAFLKALEYDFDDHSTTYYHLGWIAFLEEDYEQALQYTQEALKINPRNDDALWLSEQLEERQQPLSNRLARFFRDYYLYMDDEATEKINMLESQSNASTEEVVHLFSESLQSYDPYSFVFWGQDYDEFKKEQEEKTVTHATCVLDGMSYELFTIDFFNHLTGREFITLAEGLQNKEKKVLVFDVRGNTGGDMNACAEILDYLLGDCTIINYVDRKGYVSSYYSSADRVAFKQIIVLTDQRTASAAELLTLALKVYLPDTQIIGDVTFGKGVSQKVFEEPRDKVALLLVNAYWNVREINIDGYGIAPDVKAISEKDVESALKNTLNMIQ